MELITYPIEKLKEVQLAYIAGIVDGEGCLTMSKQTKGNSIFPALFVKMTSIECVSLLHTTTGMGSFYVVKQVRHYKQQYRWEVRSRLELYILLEALQPYLVVKKKQANVLLEFVKRRIQEIPIGGRDFNLLEDIHKLNS